MKTGSVIGSGPASEGNTCGVAELLGKPGSPVNWYLVAMPGGEKYHLLETEDGEVFAAIEEMDPAFGRTCRMTEVRR